MRYEGKTLEEALERASEAIGRPADDLQYRILEERKSIFGKRVVIEMITDGKAASPAAAPPPPAEADEESVAEVTRVLRELLVAAELRVDLTHGGGFEFELSGEDVDHLLARGGEGLEALQTLSGRIAGRRLERPVFPHLDAAGFRSRKQEDLAQAARKQAERVLRSGRKVLLDPMSPSDRRVIHLTLSEVEGVETRSEGEGYFKRVGIFPRR